MTIKMPSKICSICGDKIDKQYNSSGKIVSEDGHDAQPVNNGRCCTECNGRYVIVARLQQIAKERSEINGKALYGVSTKKGIRSETIQRKNKKMEKGK